MQLWRHASLTSWLLVNARCHQRPGSSLADVVENKRSGILDSSVLEKPREDTGRQPVLLILGGGMAAGKSTVREIIGKSDFWSKVRFPPLRLDHLLPLRSMTLTTPASPAHQVAPDAVVVEADAIKECDHLFRHLRGGRTNYRDDKDARKIAHEYSTQVCPFPSCREDSSASIGLCMSSEHRDPSRGNSTPLPCAAPVRRRRPSWWRPSTSKRTSSLTAP